MSKLLRFVLIAANIIVLLWSVGWCVVLATREFPHSKRSPEGWRQQVEQVSNVEELRQMSVKDDGYIRSLETVIVDFRTRAIAFTALVSLYALTMLVRLLRTRAT